MIFRSKSFWLPKDLEHESEYQDAFSVDADRGLAAIADGVSSAIFSKRWADILTARAVAEPPTVDDSESFTAWLADGRKQWLGSIDVGKLTWHQRPKIKAGAFSTLLCVQVSRGGDQPTLSAWAVGDCCMFHVRDSAMLRSFPMERSEQFAVDTPAIGSNDTNKDHLLSFSSTSERCAVGDLIVLATDAIACWMLAELEAGRAVDWESFFTISEDDWKQHIIELRNQGTIRVDDTTLVLLRLQ